MVAFLANMQTIEFDSFKAAFPVRADEESEVMRRFMTLFVEEGERVLVGSTCYVYKARSFTGEEFAVKRLLVNAGDARGADLPPDIRARIVKAHVDAFYEEYCNLLLVSSLRGFPKLYGRGMVGDDPAIVMEWVQGVSVRDFARGYASRGERVPVRAIAALGVAVLGALDSAARLDNMLVHCDISPTNIMIRTDRASVVDQVKSGLFDICLIDFGNASTDAPQDVPAAARLGAWCAGTPEYAPPEMLAHDMPNAPGAHKSQSIDVFALCSVLYELYEGSTPWRVGDHPDINPYRAKTERAPYPVTLRSQDDADFVQAILDGLKTDQEKRLNVQQLEARLMAVASGDEPCAME